MRTRSRRTKIPIVAMMVIALWSASALSQQVQNPSTTQAELAGLIAAGTLPDLRWPNFTDYRADVKKFYDAGSNSLAWIQNGRPGAQAIAMIQLFKLASSKGLNPDDYDAAKWDPRMAKLQSPSQPPLDSDLAHIDLALTVCTMRYISDLRIGRVNPQHFKFGLDVGPKKYDLPEFVRT